MLLEGVYVVDGMFLEVRCERLVVKYSTLLVFEVLVCYHTRMALLQVVYKGN